MPPKPKSPAKGKKGKLSKAEKERLKKEELERKEKEEEDARLKAEQEEKDRLERERLEREERERIEAAESQRYTAESQDLLSLLEGNRNALVTLLEDRKQKAQWLRFMKCDGSPDPTVNAEINTYINLWKEDESRNDLDAVLKESNQTLDLINELQQYLEAADNIDLTDGEVLRYEETIVELEDLLHAKQDAATFELLKGATYQADSESGNLQLVNGNECMLFMVWGNLTKNPRFKSYEFEKSKLSFELPKQLALSNVAVRFIQTKYDHYSHRCRTFSLKKKKKKTSVLEVVEPPEEEKQNGEEPKGGEAGEAVEEDKKEVEGDAKETEEKKDEDTAEVVGEAAEENDEKTDEKQGSAEAAGASEGEAAEGGGDEDDDEDEDDEMNEFEDEDTVDLRAYQVLGGVLNFDLLALPPQPKQVKGWIMTQVTSNELQRVPYPAINEAPKLGQTLSGTITMGQTLDPKAVANAAAAAEALGAPPLGIKFKLPDNVLYSEEPQLVYWSEQGKHWRLDGFTDISFDEAEKTISFKTINFGQIACIQDKHINMPFQSWELKPLGANHVKLTIVAAILEVEIEIKEELCCFHLSAESDPKPSLDSIINKWMPPQELIKTMRAAGVNVFPERDSKKYVNITEKDEVTEETVYQQMALTASNFAYSWSKWNCEASPEKIVMLGAEKLDGTQVTEDAWSLLLMRKDRCFKLKMSEQDEEFSEVYAEGTQFHADLYHMVLELSSDAGRERINTDFRFADVVNQILSATKVVTYS